MQTLLSILLLLFSACSMAFSQQFEWALTDPEEILSCYTMATDQSGAIYTAGTYTRDSDADPGRDTWIVPQPATTNPLQLKPGSAYLRKLDKNRRLLWVCPFVPYATDSIAPMVIPEDVKVDDNGNVYLLAIYNGGLDLDPGHGTLIDTSKVPLVYPNEPLGIPWTSYSYYGALFLQKYDAAGNLLWTIRDEDVAAHKNAHLALDQFGNCYLAENRVFPFINSDGSPHSVPGCFLVRKIDANGQQLWSKDFGVKRYYFNQEMKSIQLDKEGNVYLLGSSDEAINLAAGEPSTGGFIQKMTPNGTFLWAIHPGAYYYDIAFDKDGHIYALGLGGSTTDLDPGPGVLPSAHGSQGYFVQKIDPEGKLDWAIADIENMTPRMLEVDENKNVYIAGQTQYDASGDLHPGSAEFSLAQGSNSFLVKLGADRHFVWGRWWGNASIKNCVIDRGGTILLTGDFAGQIDANPLPEVDLISDEGFSPAMKNKFLIRMTQNACSDLGILANVEPSSCNHPGGSAVVEAVSGIPPYTYEWATNPPSHDTAVTFPVPGLYGLTITDANNCQLKTALLINGFPVLPGYDLRAEIMIGGAFRPGGTTALLLQATNDECQPTSGQLVLELDSALVYQSANPEPDIVSGRTLKWNFSDLTQSVLPLEPTVSVKTIATTPLGYEVRNSVKITPVDGDRVPGNNKRFISAPVVNSYDPNVKSVLPQGVCDERYVLKNEQLTYTVQFQNTGTADAIDIVVIDTLDPALDLQSLRVIGSSHPLLTEVREDRAIRFRFDNIHLADSTTDELHSHGYVIFDVSPLSAIANRTPIKNTAFIYFDNNEAVMTNTVAQTLVTSLANGTFEKAYMSVDSSYTWNGTVYDQPGLYIYETTAGDGCITRDSLLLTNEFESDLVLFPNPTTGDFTLNLAHVSTQTKLAIYDLNGNLLEQFSYGKAQQIAIHPEVQLAEGVYLVHIETDENKGICRLVMTH